MHKDSQRIISVSCVSRCALFRALKAAVLSRALKFPSSLASGPGAFGAVDLSLRTQLNNHTPFEGSLAFCALGQSPACVLRVLSCVRHRPFRVRVFAARS